MPPSAQRGFLVPVANPKGVAPLIAIALAATEPSDPPPQVLGMVSRSSAGALSEQQAVPPPTPALTAAIEYARSLSASIDARAVWSDNPALDIIAAAQTSEVAWILLGYHRGEFGGTMGGVVREVFTRAKSLPINVGVFIHGTDHPFERVSAAVDAGADGQAVLSFALKVAQRNKCKLRALLVSRRVAKPERELVEMISAARTNMGPLFHTDVLGQRTLNQLFKQTPGRLLIIGRKLAEEIGLPLDEVPGGDRCVVVVHGAST